MTKIRMAFLAATLLLPVAAMAAEPAWVTRSNANTQLLLELTAKYSPESASSIGVEGHDTDISDFSHDQYDEITAATNGLIAELKRRAATETDPKVRQDIDILIGAAQDQLSASRLDRKYFIPFYNLDQMAFGVVRGMIDPRIPPARQQTVLARIAKYAGATPGFRPVTELARERTLERIKADAKLVGPYKGELEQALNSGAQLRAGVRDLLAKSSLKGWQKDWAKLEKQLSDYDAWVKSELLPRAREDHLLPREVYADNLHQYGVDIAPEELVARALTTFSELRNQMNITAGQIARERGLPDSDYRAVIRVLKQQQIPASEVLAAYQARLAAIEALVREHDVVTLPSRKASIRVATPAENAQQPAPHMSPPRLVGNTGEYGEFVLTTGMPPDPSGKQLAYDDFTHQSYSWTLTAHEARPGHELQFARMIEAGVSQARAVYAFNSTNVEGWGLYAEAEMQPYEPLDGQLMALQARAQRAARAFLDPMVNLGQITPEQVKSFLMDELVFSEGMATQEMQRYVFRAPGQATSYFYGYQRLMETRQRAQLALRGQFNRRAFNDFVLDQGLLPPALLQKSVMEEFVPAQRVKPAAAAGAVPMPAPNG
jgi:uncharacterized protein (DUF885 family)